MKQFVIFFKKFYETSEVSIATDNNRLIIIGVFNGRGMEYELSVDVPCQAPFFCSTLSLLLCSGVAAMSLAA